MKTVEARAALVRRVRDQARAYVANALRCRAEGSGAVPDREIARDIGDQLTDWIEAELARKDQDQHGLPGLR